MKSGYRELLRAVRASYTPEKAEDERRSELLAALVYRPLSFYLTPLFLRLGWSADGVSALQFPLALAMPAAAFAGGWIGAGAVVALALLVQVLDCVDGNIARHTRRSSPIGPVLEGLATLIFWSMYFIAIGRLGASADSFAGRIAPEVGLGLAVLLLAQRNVEDSFAHRFEERVRWTPPAADASRFCWVPKIVEQGFAFGGLLAATALGRTDWFVMLVALYQGTVFALWLPRFIRFARTRDAGDIQAAPRASPPRPGETEP